MAIKRENLISETPLLPTHPIALIGGGGHALSLLEALPAGLEIAGYIAPAESAAMPLPWLGDDAAFRARYSPEDVELLCAFVYGGRPDLRLRARIIASYSAYTFASLVAPSAVVTPRSEIAGGCAVLHRAVVNRARLGQHCVVNTGAIVEHDCRIGDNVFIGPGAVLGGEVEVGCDSFIGLGARIRNGVRIGEGVTIGMGAVVTADVPEPGVYVSAAPLRPL